MFYNALFILIAILTCELFYTNTLLMSIGLMFSLIASFALLIIYIEFELLGLAILIIYSSMCLFLIILSFNLVFRGLQIIVKSRNTFIIVLLFVTALLFYYIFYYVSIANYFLIWVDYGKLATINTSLFSVVMHKLIIKFFFIESILLNIYLFISLVACLVFLFICAFKRYGKFYKRIGVLFKIRRASRKTFNYSNFLRK